MPTNSSLSVYQLNLISTKINDTTVPIPQYFCKNYMYLYISYTIQQGDMVFNATFNNIAAISWQSVLLMEETGIPKKNH